MLFTICEFVFCEGLKNLQRGYSQNEVVKLNELAQGLIFFRCNNLPMIAIAPPPLFSVGEKYQAQDCAGQFARPFFVFSEQR